ncbi:flagellar hook-basal body complex protein FliE [Tepiditoga spiralis]|uniref:Flagellar hook-basal body complex protein FliE n=1 Tax=Tepiditoga spiralis TaxID=2108365 RepID=A0A7G1GA51_9BACT|nr:flagellar hook-basal body complex protein FliE [Tepiditoga spiralis]BBE30992.1 flagellar hook-basal body complex protein FliE [Tepiditoga spiralis]
MIEKINPISLQHPSLINKNPVQSSNNNDFSKMLKDAIDEVNSLQKNADTKAADYASGKITDVHQVIIAAEKASLSLKLTSEVTNKIVEAYKEITRMQL